MIEHGILLVLYFKAVFQGIVPSVFFTASSYGPEILQLCLGHQDGLQGQVRVDLLKYLDIKLSSKVTMVHLIFHPPIEVSYLSYGDVRLG